MLLSFNFLKFATQHMRIRIRTCNTRRFDVIMASPSLNHQWQNKPHDNEVKRHQLENGGDNGYSMCDMYLQAWIQSPAHAPTTSYKID